MNAVICLSSLFLSTDCTRFVLNGGYHLSGNLGILKGGYVYKGKYGNAFYFRHEVQGKYVFRQNRTWIFANKLGSSDMTTWYVKATAYFPYKFPWPISKIEVWNTENGAGRWSTDNGTRVICGE